MKSKEVIVAILEFICLIAAILSFSNAITVGAFALLAIYFRSWRIYIVTRPEIMEVPVMYHVPTYDQENGRAKPTSR